MATITVHLDVSHLESELICQRGNFVIFFLTGLNTSVTCGQVVAHQTAMPTRIQENWSPELIFSSYVSC